jgi:predicted Rossmann fold nucleotide-binding protein DprA/Smf involved in DNA uptake
MKLAIIGSREFSDFDLMVRELEQYRHKISEVVSGGARGADRHAEQWARRYGITATIFYPNKDLPIPARFFVRNRQIIDHCDGVIAFWDGVSTGTNHAVTYARKMGKPVKIVRF